jgi:uncharacterized surface protein with fasciclin (FAS1) repeats
MRNKIYTITKIPLLILLISALFIKCDKEDNPTSTLDTLDETIAKDAELSVFKAAIAQAKLETFTKGPGPFTIFAPTDAALADAGITMATLPAIDSITLTAFVLNHFQNIARTSFEIPEGPNGPMGSIAGFSNFSYQDKANDKIFVSGANIIARDIKCSNGIIHKINKVLLPPVLSTIATLTANPNYSLMVQAITKAGLTNTFSPAASAPVTIFALSNATMTANGYDAATIAGLANPSPALTALTNILKYHVIPTRNYSTDLKAGNLKTANGASVVVSINNGVFIKGVSNATAFKLAPVDIPASNGVIHVIADMLKP